MKFLQQVRISYGERRLHVTCDPSGEIDASEGIQWYCYYASQHATVKGSDPLRAVFAPKQQPVAHPDATIFKQCGEPPRQACELPVSCYSSTHALEAHNRNFAFVSPEIVKQRRQVLAHVSCSCIES